jgi:DNA polymerase-3 subunit beta
VDVTINRENLLPILNRVIAVVERRQTLPILGNILLRSEEGLLTIVGTDMELEIRARCNADISESGDGTVPARKFGDICRSFIEGSDIRVKLTNDRCILTSGRGRYVLGILPSKDFPSIDEIKPDIEINIEEGLLKRIFEKTSFAMAQQDVRYYLNGLLFEIETRYLNAVATDGHRLACFHHTIDTGSQSKRSFIIPYKTVNELRRQLGYGSNNVKIEISDRQIRFTVSETVSSSKLVDGRYPEYQRVIPSSLKRTAKVNRESLRKALARAAILSNEKYRGLKVTFEKGVIRLVAQNPEQEEAIEEMELEYDGETTIIGFNVSYLTDLLNAIDATDVEVQFEDGNNSSLWRGVGATDETYVVMPMRL